MGQEPNAATGIVVVWLETLLYGIYVSLFCETMYIIIRRKRTKTPSAKIFLWTSIAMFLIATAHLSINFYRLLTGYAGLPEGTNPTVWFFKIDRWDNQARGALQAAMAWLGDTLIVGALCDFTGISLASCSQIYRCYLIWDRSLRIVLLPITIFITGIVSYGICVHRVTHMPQGTVFDSYLANWVSTLYATFFVQNALTTGLIAYRIYSQHRRSRTGSSASYSNGQAIRIQNLGLIGILRIIVESAAIYSTATLLLNITYATGNNAQYIIEGTIVPIVGIVFTLMMVRLALTQSTDLLPTTRRAIYDEHALRFAPRIASDPATTGRNLSVVESGLGGDLDMEGIHEGIEDEKLSKDGAAAPQGSSKLARRSNDSSINLDEGGDDVHAVAVSPLASMLSDDRME